MKGRKRMAEAGARAGLLMILLLEGTAVSPAGAGPHLDLPRFEYAKFGFAAETGDATAIFLNPAGLSGGPGTNLYVDITGNTDGVVEYVAALQGKGLGFTYRHREPQDDGLPPGEQAVTDPGNLDTYIFAVGYGPPKLRLGLSGTWSKSTVPGDDGYSMTAGLQSSPNGMYAFGATIENLQNPKFLDGVLRPRYTYGLTIRGISRLLTLNVQGSHLDGEADLIEMHYGARVTIPSGWSFSALVDDRPGADPTFGISATWFFGKGTASARGRSLDGNDDYRMQAAVQIFDQFWQDATQKPKPPSLPKPLHPRR